MAPFDHVLLIELLEVSVTFPPMQKVVGPFVEIIGVDGIEFTVTVIGLKAIVPFTVHE